MKLSTIHKKLLIGLACACVIGTLALAGCAPQADSSSSSSASTSSASTSSKTSSSAKKDTEYTVPSVLSLTRADAEKAIVASGLRLGSITSEYSDKVAAGCVISQKPGALTKAKPNSQVSLVISKGKAEPKKVTMPDLTGKTLTDAEQALANLGLVGFATNPEETTAVAPGLVFKQSVAAGTEVSEGSRVSFTTALAPSLVTVPDVKGKSHAYAQKSITNAGLGFDFTVIYNNSVPADAVISQSVAAGTQVKAGTTVSVSISLGAAPKENVAVPNVLTFSWPAAEAAMHSAGLEVRYTGDSSGIVVAQDVVAGTKVAPNTLVTVRLAASAEEVEVPDLVGMSVASAEEAVEKVGLGLDIDSGGFHGTVIEQIPEAGTKVSSRATIHIIVDDSDFTEE